MKRIVGFYAVCVVMVGLFVLSPWTVFAQDKWAIGTSTVGSGPYVLGGHTVKVLNKHQSSVRLSPQVTAGNNENVELVSTGEIQMGQQSTLGLLEAYTGKGVFSGKPHKRLRVLFTYTLMIFHGVAREASNIKAIEDIRMKKINIGQPAMTTRIDNEALLQAANIKLEDIKIFQLATPDAFNAIKDGVIDSTFNLYGVPHAGLLELAITTKVNVISIPDEIIDRLEKIRPGLFKFTIPANTYRGQESPVKTFASPVVLFARDDLPEDKVYEITKAFWSNLAELQQNQTFKSLSQSYAYSEKMGVPYHPGALRYFKEIGLVK